MMTREPTWDAAAAAHLLSRATFGATPEAATALAQKSLGQAVEELLDACRTAPFPAKPSWVREPWINTERVYTTTTAAERMENHRRAGVRQTAERNDLRCWWLREMITTTAPLRETMTLFWHGHFTTEARRMFVSQSLYTQNNALRTHALGNFRELLGAVALDSAMMMYLNVEESDAAKPNENFARELLELFTLGIGNYSEKDVQEAARALTGWTLDAPPGASKKPVVADAPRAFCRDGLTPTFVPAKHDAGTKTILGQSGNFGARELFDRVAKHPATAQFLSRKLIAYFGVVDTNGELQERMAAEFLQTDGNIAAVVKMLLTSPEFYAEPSRGTLIKSPVHLLVGACRQLQLDVTPTPSLAQVTAAMGQELFNPPNVKGWPGGRDWISAGTLAVRYHLPEALFDGKEPAGFEPIAGERNFALPADESARKQLLARVQEFERGRRAERRKEGIKVTFDSTRAFAGSRLETPHDVVDAAMTRLLIVPPRPGLREELITVLSTVPAAERPKLAARLVLTTPEYQLA